MSLLNPRLNLQHRVRLDPNRDKSWSHSISESIISVWARRGIDPGGDRAFSVDPAGEMRVTIHDPDGRWSRWSNNAYDTLEGTPIRLELSAIRDSAGTYFRTYVLWGGWVESIDYQPKPGGMNESVLHCLGPIAYAARANVDLPGQYKVSYQSVVNEFERAWRPSRILPPTNAGTTFGVWYQDEGESVMDGLTTATVAEGGRIFEGRNGQIRCYSANEVETFSRFMDSQVLLVDTMTAPNQSKMSRTHRLKTSSDNTRANTLYAEWLNPLGHNAVAFCSEITVQPPENVIINKLLYNVDAITHNASGSVWTSSTTLPLSVDAPSGSITAVMPQGSIAVNWVTPVLGTHFNIPNNYATITVSDVVKTAHRMTVTITATGMNAMTPLTVQDLDFHAERVEIDSSHIEASATDTASVISYYERNLQWRNYLLVDEPAAATPAERFSGQNAADALMRSMLYRYGEMQLRTHVIVDANAAGRWAVEEMSVPHARVTLDARASHLGDPEDHWIRGWQYSMRSGNKATMQLTLEPVVTVRPTVIVVDTSLITGSEKIVRE